MEEPKKRPMSIDKPQSKEPKKIPLIPVQHLYDDFGYILSISDKCENEDSENSN